MVSGSKGMNSLPSLVYTSFRITTTAYRTFGERVGGGGEGVCIV